MKLLPGRQMPGIRKNAFIVNKNCKGIVKSQ